MSASSKMLRFPTGRYVVELSFNSFLLLVCSRMLSSQKKFNNCSLANCYFFLNKSFKWWKIKLDWIFIFSEWAIHTLELKAQSVDFKWNSRNIIHHFVYVFTFKKYFQIYHQNISQQHQNARKKGSGAMSYDIVNYLLLIQILQIPFLKREVFKICSQNQTPLVWFLWC